MRSTQQFSVTLPNEMANMVKNKVASGEYASESEVIRDGLRALQSRESAIEAWLQNEVAEAYDKLKANPERAIGAEQLRRHLEEKRKGRGTAAS